MIAKNLLKSAAAMAVQMVLPFGRSLRWNGSRPTSRHGRLMRSVRSKMASAALAAMKAARWTKQPRPVYCKPTPETRKPQQMRLWLYVADQLTIAESV